MTRDEAWEWLRAGLEQGKLRFSGSDSIDMPTKKLNDLPKIGKHMEHYPPLSQRFASLNTSICLR